MKRRLGQSFRFVELANDVNEHMPDYVVRRLFSALNEQGKPINGSRILLLGISFKANVGDWRESPSHRVAELLLELGADVRAVDPHVAPDRFPPGTSPVELSADELIAADAVVLLVDHDDFDPDVILPERELRPRHQGPPAGRRQRGAPLADRRDGVRGATVDEAMHWHPLGELAERVEAGLARPDGG